MRGLRGLPIYKTPQPDEWFLCWLYRVRSVYSISEVAFQQILGLSGGACWIGLSPRDADALIVTTGMTFDEVEPMLISRFAGTALAPLDGSLFEADGHGSGWLKAVLRSWRWSELVFHGRPAVCALCLAEGRAVRTHWLLPWSVVCLRHITGIQSAALLRMAFMHSDVLEDRVVKRDSCQPILGWGPSPEPFGVRWERPSWMTSTWQESSLAIKSWQEMMQLKPGRKLSTG